MARETERKFLVLSDAWRAGAQGASRIVQFYLFAEQGRSLRVRIRDGQSAEMTLKIGDTARHRDEFEYPVPLADALALRAHAVGRVLEKIRYLTAWQDHVFEIDEFAGPLAGLVVAELEGGGDMGEPPPWLGIEVTDDPRYLNAELSLSDEGPPR